MNAVAMPTSKPRRLVLNRETLRRLDEAQLARVNGASAGDRDCWTTITTVYTAAPSEAPAATCNVTGCDVDTTGDGGHTVGGHYI
jgi:hypothetical protein